MFIQDALPLPFEGERGVRGVLRALTERHGWFEEREHAGGDVISLRRGDASITLEPGAQLELSGAPHGCIHSTCVEFRGHMAELEDISREIGVTWLGLGFHPFARQQDLPWVPKLRYRIMRSYLPTRGHRAIDMMQRTCTVQANLDYEDENDAIRKLRVALAIQPITTAMFANSPFVEGKLGSHLSERAAVWLDMDPDRSGLIPFAWDGNMSLQRYVDWALDVPMFLIKRGGQILENTGQTFRAFLKEGWQGERATLQDWETHLNSLFPEARLKRILEVRGADSQAQDLVCALPALWKGWLYDAQALDQVESLASQLDPISLQAVRSEIARCALKANLKGRSVGDWARELFDIARGGLQRQSNLNRDCRDETVHLERLGHLLEENRCPAEQLLAQIDLNQPLTPQILDKAKM